MGLVFPVGMMGGVDPLVAAYFKNVTTASPGGEARLDNFIKGIGPDLTGQLYEAILLGADMQTGDENPVALISGNTPEIPMVAEFANNAHGYSSDGAAYLTQHAMAAFPSADFTLLVFFANENTGAASYNIGLLYNGAGGDGLYFATTDSSGDIKVRTLGTTPNATLDVIGNVGGLASDRSRMFAVQWEGGVGLKTAFEESAWTAQTAYTGNVQNSGGFIELRAGASAGTHQVALLFTGLLTDTELDTVRDAANSYLVTSEVRCVVEGDSIWEQNGVAPIGDQMAEYIFRSVGPFCGSGIVNRVQFNVGGTGTLATLARIEGGNLTPHAASGDNPQFFLCIGVNDMEGETPSEGGSSETVAEMLTSISTMLSIADGLGMECYVTTIHYSDTHSAARHLDRDEFNEALRSKSGTGLTFTDYTLIDQDNALKVEAAAEAYYDGPADPWTPVDNIANLYRDNVHLLERAKLAIAREANAVANVPRNDRIQYATWFETNKRCTGVATTLNAKTKGKITGWFASTQVGTAALVSFTDESDTNSDMSINFVSGAIQFLIREAGTATIDVTTDSTAFDDGAKHTFEVEVTASGSTITIDGVVQAVTYATGTSATVSWLGDVNDIDVLAIGAREESTPEAFFTGTVGEINYYDEDGSTLLHSWVGAGPYAEYWKDATGSIDLTPTNFPDRSISYDDGENWVERT